MNELETEMDLEMEMEMDNEMLRRHSNGYYLRLYTSAMTQFAAGRLNQTTATNDNLSYLSSLIALITMKPPPLPIFLLRLYST